MLFSFTLVGYEQLAGHRPFGADTAHRIDPPPFTVPVPLVASGPARPVTAAAAPDRHLPEGDKVGPGERAIWTVHRGETLRQTLGRWADRSNRTVFWLLCEDAAGSRCVDWRSAVGGVCEGKFESALS